MIELVLAYTVAGVVFLIVWNTFVNLYDKYKK